MGEGKIMVDFKEIHSMWADVFKFAKDHTDILQISSNVCFFGISNLLLYRGIMKAYDSGNNVDLSKFKTDKSRINALNLIQKNRIVFASSTAYFLMLGINCLFLARQSMFDSKFNSNYVRARQSLNSTPSSNKPDTSFMFLITSLKKSKLWVKILIFLMLTAFILKIDPNLNNILYYYRLILTNKLITLKLILIFISMFYILYFILILYLINKYSILKLKPFYSNYIPLNTNITTTFI